MEISGMMRLILSVFQILMKRYPAFLWTAFYLSINKTYHQVLSNTSPSPKIFFEFQLQNLVSVSNGWNVQQSPSTSFLPFFCFLNTGSGLRALRSSRTAIYYSYYLLVASAAGPPPSPFLQRKRRIL